MKLHRLPISLTVALLALAPLSLRAAEPGLVSVEKIWDKGSHNAFTDLIRWHDTWYCTFRESEAHVGGNGKLRVLESGDGKTWKSAALIAEEGSTSAIPSSRSRPTAG